jgi:enoyl-CoA hydratase/carnithine racemase
MAKPQSVYDPETAPRDLKYIRYEKKDHVAVVTIDRPEVRNALHSWAYQELRSCWRDIGRDPNIYVAILTGTGQAFCAGRDVKFLAEHRKAGKQTPHEDPNSPHFWWGGGGQPQDVELEKPLIAALNGFAVGVGLNMALQCQLRVMAEDAWIGDQHTNVGRLGAPQEIYAALPRTAAAYLSLCNGRLSAQECLQLGIVNRVAPKDKVLESAEELAAMVCAGSPLAAQGVVRMYRLAAAFPPSLAAYAKALDKEVAETEDGEEGARAFAEKRKPVWKMR